MADDRELASWHKWNIAREGRGLLPASFTIYKRIKAQEAHEAAQVQGAARLEAAVESGMTKALAKAFEEEPEKFDALDSTVSAAAMARQFPGTEGMWMDRHAVPRPSTATPVSATERLRMERRAQQVEAGRVDFKSASPQEAEQRLRQLGTDAVVIGDLNLRPIPPPAPPAPEPVKSGIWLRSPRELSERQRAEMGQVRTLHEQRAAEAELSAAREAAASTGGRINALTLSRAAFALYQREKGHAPEASVPFTATPGAPGGK